MAVGNLEFIKSASGSSVTTLDVTNCFTSKYDVYVFSIDKVDAQAGGYFNLRFLDSGGTVISASEYDYANLIMLAYSSFVENKATADTGIERIMRKSATSEENGGGYHYVFNPNDSSSYTFYLGQSGGSVISGSGLVGLKSIGVHKSAEQITGFQLYGATFDTLEVSVYGLASN
tara:strand:+ start:1193 stop:1714 length:522 start_codon:yes stop_codon:yes gene_type:complete